MRRGRTLHTDKGRTEYRELQKGLGYNARHVAMYQAGERLTCLRRLHDTQYEMFTNWSRPPFFVLLYFIMGCHGSGRLSREHTFDDTAPYAFGFFPQRSDCSAAVLCFLYEVV